MNLRAWIIGCLNSGMEQAAKLGLIVLSAYTIGTHLDVATLAVSISVGFIFGALQWVFFNPIKDITPQARLLTFLNK